MFQEVLIVNSHFSALATYFRPTLTGQLDAARFPSFNVPNQRYAEIQTRDGHNGKNLAFKSNLDLNLGSLKSHFFIISTSKISVKIKTGYISKIHQSAIIIISTQILIIIFSEILLWGSLQTSLSIMGNVFYLQFKVIQANSFALAQRIEKIQLFSNEFEVPHEYQCPWTKLYQSYFVKD